MTDKKPQPSSPQAPPLTEQQRVSRQVGVTDTTTEASQALAGMFPFGGSPRFFGTTDFESHRLNEMIDLVEHAKPEHLTGAGEALFAACEAIHEAAGALGKDIARVAWEGQAGNAFRDWGKNLANHARDLADFAGTAAAQISAAGTGLASVRQAMPPRDHRAEPVRATDLPAMKRVAGNAEYEAAVRAEKDRQEAINQMNRLSSFYTVSEQTLAAQQPPVFQSMPVVGVPQPEPGFGKISPVSGSSGEGGTHHYSVESSARSRHSATAIPPALSRSGSLNETDHHTSLLTPPHELSPDRGVNTDLNSVAPPPSVPNRSTVTLPPASISVTGPSGLPTLPPLASEWTPAASGSGKALGRVNEPIGATRATAGSASGAERGVTSAAGRSAIPGQVAARGATTPGQAPVVRGVMGGSPRPIAESSGRVGSTPARGQGISGGRPSGMTSGSTGARAPRSPVVGGAQPALSAQSAARPGQRGAVGAQDRIAPSKAPYNRIVARAADGVVGTPQGRVSRAQTAHRGFTTGGSGLLRRSGNEATGEEEQAGAPRSDFLVEDEESLLPSRPETYHQ